MYNTDTSEFSKPSFIKKKNVFVFSKVYVKACINGASKTLKTKTNKLPPHKIDK